MWVVWDYTSSIRSVIVPFMFIREQWWAGGGGGKGESKKETPRRRITVTSSLNEISTEIAPVHLSAREIWLQEWGHRGNNNTLINIGHISYILTPLRKPLLTQATKWWWGGWLVTLSVPTPFYSRIPDRNLKTTWTVFLHLGYLLHGGEERLVASILVCVVIANIIKNINGIPHAFCERTIIGCYEPICTICNIIPALFVETNLTSY